MADLDSAGLHYGGGGHPFWGPTGSKAGMIVKMMRLSRSERTAMAFIVIVGPLDNFRGGPQIASDDLCVRDVIFALWFARSNYKTGFTGDAEVSGLRKKTKINGDGQRR